ncbi:MAG: hypothetical protein WC867_00990 [Candidatus Pacearchaeota archaeon]|jgi:hypothetical protein
MVGVKFFGYLAAGIGLVGLALSSKKMMDLIPFLKSVSPAVILVPSLILVGVGIILLLGDGKSGAKSKLGTEVPIYKGKEIVGYRVLK